MRCMTCSSFQLLNWWSDEHSIVSKGVPYSPDGPQPYIVYIGNLWTFTRWYLKSSHSSYLLPHSMQMYGKKSLSRSPPQKLEVSPRSGLYILVMNLNLLTSLSTFSSASCLIVKYATGFFGVHKIWWRWKNKIWWKRVSKFFVHRRRF